MKMKVLKCFILTLSLYFVSYVSAEEVRFNSSTSLTESTTSTPVTELNSTTPAPVSSSTPPTVPSTVEPSTSPSNTTEVQFTTSSPVVEPNEAIYTLDDSEPSELMLVLNNSGIACILLKMEVTLTIQYTNVTNATVIGTFPITEAVVNKSESSSCSNPATVQTEYLTADFNTSNSLYFFFNHTSKDKYAVTSLKFSSANLASLFPDAMNSETLSLQSDGSIYETSSNMSVKCNSELKVTLMDSEGNATNHFITFKMVQMEAFRTTDDDNFSNAMDCEADEEISNIVPIAVGCALAGLVIIVLIAYLVGRRQKRQRGYESV